MTTKRKIHATSLTNDKSSSKVSRKMVSNDQDKVQNVASDLFLTSLNIYIVPAGIQKARLSVFKTQVVKFGGSVQDKFSTTNNLSHIIVEDNIDRLRIKRLLNIVSLPSIPIVKSAWLSLCLRNKRLENYEDYELLEKRKEEEPLPSGSKGRVTNVVVEPNNSSEYDSSDEEQTPVVSSISGKSVQAEKWICSQSSKNPKPNLNSFITDKLEEMVKAYESTNDKWRAFGYQKAIQSLRRHPKQITTWEEAKALPGIGQRLADKIWEVAQSGELRKLKEFQSSKELQVLNLFTNVWGAGPHTAQLWYQQGFRSIADLQEKANLNYQQKIGVRLYDDLLERMPREEAAEIEKVVKNAAEKIQPGIIAQTCGSYRRGKTTCGDVDILITHPDGKSHRHVFHKLLTKLKESRFLTDDLVSAEETGNQKKYMGICKLPGENKKHRRLDIIVVPYNEYGCALVYFTGSAHFNRSLRHLCKKQNMSLNEHALKQGVVRKGGEKIFEGTIIPTPSEESVFKVLNVPYRPPEERDH